MKNYILCIILFLQGSESTTLASFLEKRTYMGTPFDQTNIEHADLNQKQMYAMS